MSNEATIADLAIFGAKPAFSGVLHVGRPNLGDRQRFLSRVGEMLDRRWLTNNGPYVKELEQRLAGLLEVKHCICMCNGTVALEIATRALDLRGEVIIPSFTFVATAHALQWQEITPIFCDIDPATHNIDPQKVKSLITPRTSGILGVHAWGRACDVPALAALARRHRLKLLFDAAHGFACTHQGRMIGGFGDAEVFSFHATKFFNTFEGGAVTTNNDDLAEKIRLMRNFGFSGMDNVIYVGTNGKMSEVCAAMGLTGLESITEFIAANRRNYDEYRQRLDGVPGLQMIAYDSRQKNNYQYVIVEVDESIAGLSRNDLVRVLHAENVLARRYFYPGCHKMEPYRSLFPSAGMMLPETERLCERVLSLPTGTAVCEADVRKICELIRLALASGTQVKRRLAELKSPAGS